MTDGDPAKYRLLRRLKAGGMGEVFLACQRGPEGFEKLVVLKRVLAQFSSDSRFSLLFLQEARVSAQLRHPNIVQIHDFGKTEDGYFLCMEFVDGPNLREFMEVHRERQIPVPLAAAVWIAAKIFGALDYAHERAESGGVRLRVVHRDVSPPNILLSREGEVKLSDFGLAKVEPWSHETSTGILRGKFPYMSPEYVTGRPQDHLSDLYAAGVVLFELLAGQTPFKDEGSPLKLLEEIRSKPAPDIRTFRPEVPPPLAALVASLLAKEPEERIQSARQAQLALESSPAYRGYSERKLARQIARFSPGPFLPGAAELEERTPSVSRPLSRPSAVLADVRRPTPEDGANLREGRGRIEAVAPMGLTRFVGRDQEMRVLQENFEKAREGSGRVVGITGDAGVGKSRLVIELRRLVPLGACRYLEGRSAAYGGSMAFKPILEVVKELLGVEEGDPHEAIGQRIGRKLRELEPEGRIQAAALLEFLSLDVEDDQYLQIGPQEREKRILESVRDLILLESRSRPVILVLEDLQWIDRSSQEFLDFFVEAVPSHPILLLLLYRPEYSHAWASKPWFTEIRVGQLTNRTSAMLLKSILREGEVAPELRDLILGRARGNPLFVEELDRSLLENGSIEKRGNRYVLAREPSASALSDTVQGIISARMERIEENLRRILQVASVIGKEFAYGILTTITGMSEELKACLLRLQGLGFVFEKRLFPDLEYVFKHALTQEAAYHSLLGEGRKNIHAEVARAIEKTHAQNLEEYYDLLAYHYTSGDNPEKALKYLDLANRKALRTNAVEEAKSYFDQAMEVLARLPDTRGNRVQRITLLARQEQAFYLLFRLPEYYELLSRFEPMAAAIDVVGVRGAFYSRMAFCEFSFGHFDRALGHALEAAALCDESGDQAQAAFALYVAECCLLYKGDLAEAVALGEKALSKLSESFDLVVYVRVRVVTSWAFCLMGRWDEALEQGSAGLAKAKEFSDESLGSFASLALTLAYGMKGDTERAIEFGEQGLRMTPTPADEILARSYHAWALSRSGKGGRDTEYMGSLFRALQAAGLMIVGAPVGSQLCDVLLAAADYEEAREVAGDLLELADRDGGKWFSGRARRCLGEAEMNLGLAKEAEAHLEQSLTILKSIQAENEAALALAALGRLRKKQRRWKVARQNLTEALETFERLGTRIEPERVRQELASLPG